MNFTRIILTGILLVITDIGFSQESKFCIGPDGGPGLSIVTNYHALSVNGRPNVSGMAGYSFQYNFNKIFSLRTVLAYERKGFYRSGNGEYVLDAPNPDLAANNTRMKLDYLTLPILARASFGNKIKFFVNAGPYIGVLLNAELKYANAYNTYNFTSTYQRFDAGISAGLGISINLSRMFVFSIEGRNNMGLYSICKVLPNEMPSKTENNSTNLIFSLGYRLVKCKGASKKR